MDGSDLRIQFLSSLLHGWVKLQSFGPSAKMMNSNVALLSPVRQHRRLQERVGDLWLSTAQAQRRPGRKTGRRDPGIFNPPAKQIDSVEERIPNIWMKFPKYKAMDNFMKRHELMGSVSNKPFWAAWSSSKNFALQNSRLFLLWSRATRRLHPSSTGPCWRSICPKSGCEECNRHWWHWWWWI